MDKILIEVFLPASGEAYDVRVPPDSLLGEVTGLIAKQLEVLSKGQYVADGSGVLCDAETGRILDINRFVAELEIQNGTRLMLI